MKLSKERTGYILISAYVSSEWDTCNYCLVSFNDKTLERWKNYSRALEQLREQLRENIAYPTEIHKLSIWEHSMFLNLDEDNEEYAEIIEELKELPFVHVALEEGEEDKLQVPEQRIDCLQANFYTGGRMSFIGYGKHTSEEFWTDDVEINKL